jgi:hypothetical protein
VPPVTDAREEKGTKKMNFEDFKWIINKVDDPKSCLNLSGLESIRQNLLGMVAECYATKNIDHDLELTWDSTGRNL